MNTASWHDNTRLMADRLIGAWHGGARPPFREVLPADRTQAFAVQDATLQAIGPAGGWKVGAKGPDAEPTCAPMPARGLMLSGARVPGPAGAMRGVELEVALRLGRDLIASGPDLSMQELASAVDAVVPVVEVVETRLADWRGSDPLAQLADLQSHGALVVGADTGLAANSVDLRKLQAELRINGQLVANTVGGNPAADVWHLMRWLAWHCTQRGQPLRAGQLVTTGSCTGMLFAPAGAQVAARIVGVGTVDLRF